MSELEITTIKQDLESLKRDMREVLVCLRGNLTDSMHGDMGLIPEHRLCRGRVEGIVAEVASLKVRCTAAERKIDSLVGYKKEVLSWAGGASIVLVVVWELLKTFVIKK